MVPETPSLSSESDLEAGYDVRRVQDLLGHEDLSTTTISLHVMNTPGLDIKSPLDGRSEIVRRLRHRLRRLHLHRLWNSCFTKLPGPGPAVCTVTSMGWTYSYDIICRREQLWELLETVAHASSSTPSTLREQKVKLRVREREVRVPLETLWGQELVFEGQPIQEFSFGAVLSFAVDEPLRQFQGRLPDEEEQEQRVAVEFAVSVTTREQWLDEDADEELIHYELIDAADVRVQFRAASSRTSLGFETSRTSFGFETSASMRQTFVRLAQSQHNTICLLVRKDNGVLLWLEGQELIEEVEVEESWMTREAFRRQVRFNAIARELQARTGEVFPTDLFAQAVADPEALVRVVVIRKLASSSYANRDLLAQVLLEDPVAEVRRSAAQALGQFFTLSYSPAVPALIQATLEDPDIEVRCAACHALRRESHRQDVVETAFTLLKEPSTNLRWAAGAVLSSLAQEGHIPALLDALSDEDVVSDIAVALGRLRALDAVDPLCQLLERSNGSRRLRTSICLGPITTALASIGDRRAVPHLIRLLETGECRGRSAAASALGVLGDTRAIESLTLARDDGDSVTKSIAAKSLERIRRLNEGS